MRGRMRNVASMVLALVGFALIGFGGICVGDDGYNYCEPPPHNLPNRCQNNCTYTPLLCDGTLYFYTTQEPQAIGTCEPAAPPQEPEPCDDWEGSCPTDYFKMMSDCAGEPTCSNDIPEAGCVPD